MDNVRLQTIENIKANILAGEFNRKAEPFDPDLDDEQIRRVLHHTVDQRSGLPYKFKNWVAHTIADVACHILNRDTLMVGMENIRGLRGGAIVTSNHFDPLECTIIHEMGRRNHKGHIFGVSQATNFAMPGFLGFILKYYDMIPVSADQGYMTTHFEPLLKKALDKKKYVLIYSEQELWWHYRKPRPPKRGAYHYAAKFGVPVIPCFVEMREQEQRGKDGFRKLKYVLHIMEPIWPDPLLSLKDNSIKMMRRDYELKKAAYEKAYGKPLDYTFENWDIAGLE